MEQKIRLFWDWFIRHEAQFRVVTDPRAVTEMLNNQVLDFGLFAWEIGKGAYKNHSFTISPNGDKARLRLSKQIIRAAPIMPEWEFYPSKPPRNWDFTFEMFDSAMIKQTFDASEWEYVMLDGPSEQIDLILCADNIRRLDYEDLPQAADLVVTNILGEECKINHIHQIDLVEYLEPEYDHKRKALTELKDDFSFFL